jgi:hypothetical protein
MKMKSKDPDIQGSLPALRRAARAAKKLAEMTGTPVYVVKDGRVINLNPVGGKRRVRTSAKGNRRSSARTQP